MSSPRAPAARPLALGEDLLCCLGPGFPPLAEADPERIGRIERELAAGFSALAGAASEVHDEGMIRERLEDMACLVVAGELVGVESTRLPDAVIPPVDAGLDVSRPLLRGWLLTVEPLVAVTSFAFLSDRSDARE